MKKFLTVFAALFAALACVAFAACADKQPVKADENTVVITANSNSFGYGAKTLKDYMQFLQDEEKLTFEISGGMVTCINSKANTLNSYWMLYTSDAENSDSSWGSLEYEGNIYGSATLGADALVIKENCVYIWAYQTF